MSTDRQRQDYPDNAVSSRELRAVVERYEDAPDQCTIFPTGLDGSLAEIQVAIRS